MKNKILSLALALVMLVSTFAATSVSTATDVKFDDVTNPSHWSYANIMYVAENGIMNGVGGGMFAPGMTMTRAQVVRALYNLAGTPDVKYTAAFSDVAAGAWYTEAVIWAVEKSITAGAGDGKFAPDRELTRGELAMFMYKYAENVEYIATTEKADISGYADYADVPSYFVDAMSWINGENIMVGVNGNKLAPKMEATREQFARIINLFDIGEYDYRLVYNAPKYGQNYVEPEYELVEDADIYVSTTGSNDAEGTKEDPILTFAEAKARVRELIGSDDDEIKVAFFAGNYGSLDTLLFEAADGGSEAQPITYCAYGDGPVVFSNGVQIQNEEFEPITSEEAKMFPEEAASYIQKVDLRGKVETMTEKSILFGGDGACEEARFPNSDEESSYYKNATTRVEEEGKEEREYDKLKITIPWIATKYVNKFTTYEGLKITGHLRTGWFLDTFPVKAYDASEKTLQLDFENWNLDESAYPISNKYPLAYEGRMDDTIYFHNLAEFLDNEGEYWFDDETKILYVYEPTGDYTIPTGDTFMFLTYGTSYINFVGLEFTGSASDAMTTWGANSHITLDRCVFGNVSGKNVVRFNDSTNITVKNSEFYNFICGGVVLRSDANSDLLESGNNNIINNYFHDFGDEISFDEAVAIQLYHDVGAYIAHNEFVNGAHGAIRFDWCIDTIIEYNVFDNMMNSTSDFGAVYSYIMDLTHRGNVIRYNLFTNMRDEDAQHGVYLDGASGNEVYGNLFYNSGACAVMINGGRDNNIYDNFCINESNGRLVGYIGVLQNVMDSDDPYGNAIRFLSYKPEVGEPGYEKWVDRWPILYQYTFDTEDLGDPYCVYTCVNHFINNKVFGSEINPGEAWDLYAVKENNEVFELSDNPYFADPTHGDYTIVNTEGFTEVFSFNMVGRK